MNHVDGNVLAGPLAELFAFDATMASTRCGGCGVVSMLATSMVYMDAMGTVARCADCETVLLTLVVTEDRAWLRTPGLSAIEVPR